MSDTSQNKLSGKYVSFCCPECGERNITPAEQSITQLRRSNKKLEDLWADQSSQVIPVEINCQYCDNALAAEAKKNSNEVLFELPPDPETHIELVEGARAFVAWSQDLADAINPPHPVTMCFDALNTVIDVARRMSTKRGDSLMNRMMFGQLISIWETCLGDLLILEIKKHPDCLVELVTADKCRSKRKFSKGDFSPDNPLVREEVFKYLQSIVYQR